MQKCPEALIDTARRIADAVGRIHLEHFRRHPAIEIKDDGTPVKEVDRLAEKAVRAIVAAEYPAHGVIGEEFPPSRPEADFVWVVDPLDGTQLFIMGRPLFGLLLALAYRGRFILGVIDHAVLGERWVGADGHGTYLNDVRVRTRRCASLHETMLVRPGHRAGGEREDSAIDAVAGQSRWVQWGLTPYDYGLIASGHLDLILSAGPKLHDLAPLDPVIRNAGGKVTDWFGRPLTLSSGGTLIATGDETLLPMVVPRLREAVPV